ncbi:MAG: hypothetical protein ACE15F_04070 [bacterium]
MPDPSRRKQIEDTLTALLRTMQKSLLADPRLKKMVEQLRKSYHEDKDDFLLTLGLAEPPSPPVPRRTLPSSRIPRLLLLLNRLPLRQKPIGSSLPPQTGAGSDQAFWKKEIENLEKQIQQAKEILIHMKSEEKAVARRQGIYANPTERLKAERLLREMPSLITQWSQRKALLEQYLAELNHPGGNKT